MAVLYLGLVHALCGKKHPDLSVFDWHQLLSEQAYGDVYVRLEM